MGGKYSIIIFILLLFIIFHPVIEGFKNNDSNSFTFVYGKALLSNGDIPIGGQVKVNDSLNNTFLGKILPSGDWQVTCGFSIGCKFTVQITYKNKWYGSKTLIYDGLIGDVGEIILYPTCLISMIKYEMREYIPNDYIQFNGFAYGGNSPYSYYWDFGDGTCSDFQNPMLFYKEPGLYDVILTVEDASNNIANDSIQINIEPFSINIVYEDKEYMVNNSIKFTGSIMGGTSPYQFYWDFGDGEYSYDESPVHSYLDCGGFNINLNVTDSKGYSKSTETVIVIHPIPVFSSRGIIHEIHFNGYPTEKFPLGWIIFFAHWPDVWYNPAIYPIYYAHIKTDNLKLGEKVATYTAYNIDGDVVFNHVFYEEFTITIFFCFTICGPQFIPFMGRAVVFGS